MRLRRKAISSHLVSTVPINSTLLREEGLAAVIGAFGFVLSSTAVIMKMMDDRGEGSSAAGQRNVAILLLEDLAIIPLLTFVATAWLFVIIPKGFFPEEDIGQIQVTTESAEDTSFPAMVRLQERAAGIIRADPNVAAVSSFNARAASR